MKYHLVVCGGTFDHWHAGHTSFLHSILSLSEKVLLGITSDWYVSQHKSSIHPLESFDERKRHVEEFLHKEHARDRVTIAPIDSVLYPPAWEVLPIEAILVTKETEKGANIINHDREQRGIPRLPVVTIPLVLDDHGEKIASTHIREGKINNDGVSYIQPSWFATDLFLPEVEKQWFKEPFGELYADISFITKENPTRLVTVGDQVTRDCNIHNIGQQLSVVDFAIQRKSRFTTVKELGFSDDIIIFHADNPPSHITTPLFQAIAQAVEQFSQNKRLIIVVRGEEDLAVIPLVLALPLDVVIIYGQPHRGIVRLPITPNAKERAHTLLKHFIQKLSK